MDVRQPMHSDHAKTLDSAALRREFLVDRVFDSIEQAQGELDAWVHDYNTARPHQALDMTSPAERFGLEPLARDERSVPVDAHEERRGQWVMRRVGSNSVVVSPVDVADGAYVAAGTALTADVEPGQIAIARGRQRNIDGWVARARPGTATAAAAEEARARHPAAHPPTTPEGDDQ